MEDQIISLETAKLAKEKGFPIIEKGFYIEGVFTNRGFSKDFHRWYKDDPLIQSAPTQSLLQRWLREVHNIDIFIWKNSIDGSYRVDDILLNNEELTNLEFEVGFDNYENALEEGLYEALKLI